MMTLKSPKGAITALALTAVAFGLTPSARAGLSCQDATHCYFSKMPLLDQTDDALGSKWLPNGGGASMLCGSTSSTMALNAVISETSDTPTGWTAQNFLGRSWLDQVRNMSALESISPTKGGFYLPWIGFYGVGQFAGRKRDFKHAGGHVGFYGPTVTNQTFIDHLHGKHKQADIINYGHYYKKTKKILGVKTTWFSRQGGHFVAVNGHSGDALLIFNPWGAVREWRSIGKLHGGLGGSFWHPELTVLPTVGFTSSYLFSDGDYYAIIDGELGLWAD